MQEQGGFLEDLLHQGKKAHLQVTASVLNLLCVLRICLGTCHLVHEMREIVSVLLSRQRVLNEKSIV